MADRELPDPPRPQGRYLPAVVHGGLVFSAGMTPRAGGELTVRGIVGADLTVGQARSAAGLAATNALSAVASAAGGLDRLCRCLKLTVYIACTAAFTEHSAVADGASEALSEFLGDRAAAVRTAIGVASLPSGAPVEVELLAALGWQGADPWLPAPRDERVARLPHLSRRCLSLGGEPDAKADSGRSLQAPRR